MRMIELYPAGQRVELGSLRFTAADIIRFATEFDPQPFHTDAEKARDTMFGALCASGWHTCAGWMKTMVAFRESEAKRLAAQGIEPPRIGPSPGFRNLRWLKPVFAGDTITYYQTPLDSRASRSRPGLWINTGLSEGINQHGEPVLSFESSVIEHA
ncbi:MaoC family dehydratase [Rhizobiaceae bacterium BDR2-2]|uniref:MaoC family dehydratase n=1 Tax=Ectorhizobium quercum TaxID=2965071 RepID=A0AAE3MYU3_9HYPH|nr:MaoC family dehydratase [Ectorhizobium quercum]MCX8996584.1 MaoC family dehydratase [Ectorhizobium quercum]